VDIHDIKQLNDHVSAACYHEGSAQLDSINHITVQLVNAIIYVILFPNDQFTLRIASVSFAIFAECYA
jgi:hypothetical protein